MAKRVTLAIATFQRAAVLAKLLALLEGQTLERTQWEVVVCVDGSTDGTSEVLKRKSRQSTLPLTWFEQENAGQAAARHQAILRGSSERVVVIDDDMEPCPGFLAEHLAAAEGDPARTVVIGKVEPEQGWRKKPLYEAVREHHMLALHRRLERGEQLPSATAFITQNVSFPRALYLEVGGFDPSLRLDEDRELGIRLERGGGQLVFHPPATAVHHSDIGSYEKWEQRQYGYGATAVQIWEKHGRHPLLHPLRNLVTGSRANRLAVHLLARWDWSGRVGTSVLRAQGQLLRRMGLFWPALATHKAILAVQYHLGVKHSLGSWPALIASEREYQLHPERAVEPTGRGRTV